MPIDRHYRDSASLDNSEQHQNSWQSIGEIVANLRPQDEGLDAVARMICLLRKGTSLVVFEAALGRSTDIQDFRVLLGFLEDMQDCDQVGRCEDE